MSVQGNILLDRGGQSRARAVGPLLEAVSSLATSSPLPGWSAPKSPIAEYAALLPRRGKESRDAVADAKLV
jgi:hypothetical protein